MKPNNKSLFDCSLMRIQLNNQSSSAEAGRGGNSQLEDVRLLRLFVQHEFGVPSSWHWIWKYFSPLHC